jgi:hypothetical protein
VATTGRNAAVPNPAETPYNPRLARARQGMVNPPPGHAVQRLAWWSYSPLIASAYAASLLGKGPTAGWSEGCDPGKDECQNQPSPSTKDRNNSGNQLPRSCSSIRPSLSEEVYTSAGEETLRPRITGSVSSRSFVGAFVCRWHRPSWPSSIRGPPMNWSEGPSSRRSDPMAYSACGCGSMRRIWVHFGAR